jgi:hypothetical protein
MTFLMITYKRQKEEPFSEITAEQEEEAQKLTCMAILSEIVSDYKFWRFMLFSFVIVGSKMVFSLLFFMIPKMMTQDGGENAPFGIYIAAAPLLIIIFLLCLSPI